MSRSSGEGRWTVRLRNWIKSEIRELFKAVTVVQARDGGGFYCIHVTDEETVALGIDTVVTASLAFKTTLGSQLRVF